MGRHLPGWLNLVFRAGTSKVNGSAICLNRLALRRLRHRQHDGEPGRWSRPA